MSRLAPRDGERRVWIEEGILDDVPEILPLAQALLALSKMIAKRRYER